MYVRTQSVFFITKAIVILFLPWENGASHIIHDVTFPVNEILWEKRATRNDTSLCFEGSQISPDITDRMNLSNSTRLFYSADAQILHFLSKNASCLTNLLFPKSITNKSVGQWPPPQSILLSFDVAPHPNLTDNGPRRHVLDDPETEGESNFSDSDLANINGLILNWSKQKPCPASMEEQDGYFFVLSRKLKQFYSVAPPPIGIGYDISSISCDFISNQLVHADFIVLTVEFKSSVNFPESYGLFARFMNSVVKKNSNFMKDSLEPVGLPKITSIYQLKMKYYHSSDSESPQIREAYDKLLVTFATQWASEYNQRVILDFGRTATGNGDNNHKTGNWKDVVISQLFNHYFNPDPNDSCSCCRLPLRKMMTYIRSAFSQIYLNQFPLGMHEEKNWESLGNCFRSNCSSIETTNPEKLYFMVKLQTVFGYPGPDVIANLLNFLEGTNLQVATVIIKDPIYEEETEKVRSMTQQLQPIFKERNIKLACRPSVINWSDLEDTELLDTSCESLVEFVQMVIWDVKFRFDYAHMRKYSFDYYVKTVQANLQRIIEKKIEFLKKYPGQEILLQFNFEGVAIPDEVESLYCSDTLMGMNEYVEAIISWARIHEIRVIIKPAFEYLTSWFKVLSKPRHLNLKVVGLDDMFVAKMRNHPESMGTALGIETDPCVSWTRAPKEDGVKFGNFVGVTMNLKKKGGEGLLEEGEAIRTALQFTCNKFKNVEILIPEFVQRLANLKPILSQECQNGSHLVLLNLDMKNVKLNDVKNLADSLSDLKIGGIHISNWLNHVRSEKKNLLSKFSNFVDSHDNIVIGAELENCTHQVNKVGFHLKKFVLGKVSYLICEETLTTPFLYTNQDKKNVANFLDGHLVLINIIQKIAPNINQIYFRLNPVSRRGGEQKREHVKNFLQFVNDLSQFAEGYGVNYLIQAFDTSLDRLDGWWTVDNSSFADPSAYTEKEAHFFNQTTWTPPKKPSDEINPNEIQPFPLIWLVVGLAISSLFLLGAASYFAIRESRLSRILSDEEVREFLNGRESSEDSGFRNVFDHLRFSPEFQISKKDLEIESDKILGVGNFGVVRRGTVGETKVAIKSPKNSCSKESFIGMLSEVKLLCHIGRHVNVVGFVGACTKEISRGMIYIVTELCSNGSLQSYLRRNVGIESQQSSLNLYELLKFSSEIASGMDYISSKSVIHGDLSTRNVLLDEFYACKITDFGLSRKIYEYGEIIKKDESEQLPWKWMAYETLARMEFTIKSDVWSYGVTLWEIFSLGGVPYPGMTWANEFVDGLKSGMRLPVANHATTEIHNKLLECWRIQSELRPNFSDLFAFFSALRRTEYDCLGASSIHATARVPVAANDNT